MGVFFRIVIIQRTVHVRRRRIKDYV